MSIKKGHIQSDFLFCTVLNWDDNVTAPCDGLPWVAWRALKILVVFTTAFKWERTCPMMVKQSLAWIFLNLDTSIRSKDILSWQCYTFSYIYWSTMYEPQLTKDIGNRTFHPEPSSVSGLQLLYDDPGAEIVWWQQSKVAEADHMAGRAGGN